MRNKRMRTYIRVQADRFRVYVADFPKRIYISFKTWITHRLQITVRMLLRFAVTRRVVAKVKTVFRVTMLMIIAEAVKAGNNIVVRAVYRIQDIPRKTISKAACTNSELFSIKALALRTHAKTAIKMLVTYWVKICDVRGDRMKDVRELRLKDYMYSEYD